jgi:hypothetical protein
MRSMILPISRTIWRNQSKPSASPHFIAELGRGKNLMKIIKYA